MSTEVVSIVEGFDVVRQQRFFEKKMAGSDLNNPSCRGMEGRGARSDVEYEKWGKEFKANIERRKI